MLIVNKIIPVVHSLSSPGLPHQPLLIPPLNFPPPSLLVPLLPPSFHIALAAAEATAKANKREDASHEQQIHDNRRRVRHALFVIIAQFVKWVAVLTEFFTFTNFAIFHARQTTSAGS